MNHPARFQIASDPNANLNWTESPLYEFRLALRLVIWLVEDQEPDDAVPVQWSIEKIALPAKLCPADV